jgi:hypothetical protein
VQLLDLGQVEALQRLVASVHVAFHAFVAFPYQDATRVLMANILGPDAQPSLLPADKTTAR